MITPNEAVLHLQEMLPSLTNQFHDELPVTSGLVSGGTLTIIFPNPHGLIVGSKILVTNALIRNEIINVITNADDTISYITQDTHDLTAYVSEGHGGTWDDGLSQEISIDGVQQTVQLLADASSVPNSNEFIAVVGSPTFTPDGDDYLLENRALGVTGFKPIDTVPDVYTVTIDLSDVPDVPDGPLVMDNISTGIRVTQVADIDRANRLYTQIGNNQAWLFVIFTDRTASKDRENDDDFTSLPNSTKKILSIRQEFSTLIITPTTNNLGAGDVKSFVYVDMFTILNACLYGWLNSGYVSDGQAEYNTGYYSHAYDWEARIYLDFTDGFQNNSTVALRNPEWQQTILDEGESNGSIEY